MSKEKGQEVMEHSSFSLEFQSPDGKNVLQTAQRCNQLKIQSFFKYYLHYTYCLRHHLYHELSTAIFIMVVICNVFCYLRVDT